MASVRCVDDALGITLNDNGRLLRNIIHGADTIMSHILHFYHLSAVDFIDVSALGSPWGPQFGVLSNANMLPIDVKNIIYGNCIVLNYVKALDIRRDAHTLGSIFSGRQPIQNAIVPGGVSCMVTKTDIDTARTLCNRIRNFINTAYIIDVVTAATATHALNNAATYWTVGTNPGHLLAYGEYPFQNVPFKANTDYLISQGTVNFVGLPNRANLDPTNIRERVTYSYYSSPDNRHPSAGVTTPLSDSTTPTLAFAQDFGPQYSWIKSPRYSSLPHEVGPLARMVATYVANVQVVNLHTVSDTAGGVTPLGVAPSNYTARNLVDTAIGLVNAYLGSFGPINVTHLFSPLGRHAARALECKYIADALSGSIDGIANNSWLDQLTLVPATDWTAGDGGTPNNVAFGYTYVQIPKKLTLMGTGLTEAPRGALGHWMTIEDQKIANYQCVVPTTWNNGPRSSGGVSPVRGSAESALFGIPVCTGDPTLSGNLNDAVLNISRMLHPYDFCIACAVHVVTPEGKELAKFKIDTDGKITKYPVDSE